MTHARFKFYGSLNDFLGFPYKHKTFEHAVKGFPSIKDTVEAIGVPHPEIDAILCNGRPVDFTCPVSEGAFFKIYPLHYRGAKPVSQHLIPAIPRQPKFVLDSHLGKLMRHLRLLGFDTVYKTIFPDKEIVETGVKQRRIVLTRDIGLLKNKAVRRGHWMRSAFPDQRLKEVMAYYDLYAGIKPFSRCLECNGRIKRIAKEKVADRIPPLVRRYYRSFYFCASCRKVYWKGSHHKRLQKLVLRTKKQRKEIHRNKLK